MIVSQKKTDENAFRIISNLVLLTGHRIFYIPISALNAFITRCRTTFSGWTISFIQDMTDLPL
jgi:hypothetical protein